MKISFNEYDSKGRFFGVKKLMFHAMNNDSSLMRERLGYWLFRKMGVPAPRAVHVRLLINGKYQGVFLNVESLDDRFTKSHFSDKDGNLYKEIWPTSIEGFTEPLTAARWKSGLETNTDKSQSFDKALALGRAVIQDDGDARARALQNGMSIANTVRYIAVDRAIGLDDGASHLYCQEGRCGNHNFYVYEEEKASRFWLISWDLDSSFVVSGSLADEGDAAQRIVKAWNDHSAVCEIGPGASPHAVQQLPTACDPLWNALGCYYQDGYRAAVAELLTGPFSDRQGPRWPWPSRCCYGRPWPRWAGTRSGQRRRSGSPAGRCTSSWGGAERAVRCVCGLGRARRTGRHVAARLREG